MFKAQVIRMYKICIAACIVWYEIKAVYKNKIIIFLSNFVQIFFDLSELKRDLPLVTIASPDRKNDKNRYTIVNL